MVTISRNLYQGEIDFTALALEYPDFAKKIKPNRQLDFSDPESVRQLTLCLLKRDFDLSLNLPEDRLCPPVPNRFNYVLWLQDLLDATSLDYHHEYDKNRIVRGLDIGTGASCIYPLLGCRARPGWKFLATEVDEKSLDFARDNVARNGLRASIKILQADIGAATILPIEHLADIDHIDFVMTNPPFYESEAEMTESARKKQRPPNSACTGAPIEMITRGGEVQFVSRLILESLTPFLRKRVQWFTAMLGKLRSITIILERLRSRGCTNYAVTEFIQGQKTRRWAVAWSWLPQRPPTTLARGIPSLEKRLLPFPADFEILLSEGDMNGICQLLNESFEEVDLRWHWRRADKTGLAIAQHDVWSRKARRKQQLAIQEKSDGALSPDDSMQAEPELVVKIRVMDAIDPIRVAVRVRWMAGAEVVLFESFCGWLKRKIDPS